MTQDKARKYADADREAMGLYKKILAVTGAEEFAARALANAADLGLGVETCDCPECTLATVTAMSIGADLLARMGEAGVIATLEGVRQRWYESLPDSKITGAESYRTVAQNLRRLHPIE